MQEDCHILFMTGYWGRVERHTICGAGKCIVLTVDLGVRIIDGRPPRA